MRLNAALGEITIDNRKWAGPEIKFSELTVRVKNTVK